MPRISISPRSVVSGLLAGLLLSLGPVAPSPASPAPPADEKPRVGFRIATLNLVHTLTPAAIRHDVREVISTRRPTVIGFQERRDTKRALRAALPDHWALRMPTTADGTDDNPIAFDKRVWKEKHSWARPLATHTWHRHGGNEAVDQYGVVTVLKHRRTGHVIRAVSFHMPNLIHNRATGGPNWGERERLGAFWRMADNLRELARSTPEKHQFVALCDCNVTESRDHSRRLVKGELTRPLDLENNYSAAGYRFGWRIDYVMAERRSPFRIVGWWALHDLRTDHPAVITRFRRR